MSLRSFNAEDEKKSYRLTCFTLGVISTILIVAFVSIYSNTKNNPHETISTSELPETTKNLETSITIEDTTSTTRETSTTTAPTIPTITTITTDITCYQNSDCGVETEKKVCYQENVYLKRITPICRKPGTLESYCVSQESWVTGSLVSEPIPLEKCRNRCMNGTCT